MADGLENKSDEVRLRELGKIPASYSPWLHLMGTTGVGLAALALGLWQVKSPSLGELAVVPLTLLGANGFEWRVHRDILHRRRPPFGELYDRHTPIHHVVYPCDDMSIRSWKELRLVLIPASGVLGIVIATAPVAWLLGRLVSPNAGWVFLVTAALYMVSYELFHLAYHLPSGSAVGRMRLVQVLREHHARHHDPRLMRRWNFNVTLPLFDWLHGTIAPSKAAGAEPSGEGP